MALETKICEREDLPRLTEYMRAEWSKSHIMANSPSYIDNFFRDAKTGRYNIIFALDSSSNEIGGFIAYVPASFYDAKISPEKDFLWVTNWLASKKHKKLGLALYAKMLELTGQKCYGTVGHNETAEILYKAMGFKTGALTQFFTLRRQRGRMDAPPLALDGERLRQIEPFNEQYPQKTADFIINKYMKSPYYTYFAYGTGRGAIIFRIQEYPGGQKKCLRITEYFGDAAELPQIGVNGLLHEFGAEYADFYCAGIPEEILKNAGFEKNGGQVLLPNYFEPFVNENIEIRFAYKMNGNKDGFTVYKGDGDRDFPRIG